MFRISRGGRLMNHLRRAWRAPEFLSGAEDPAFPIARAYDHRSGAAAHFDDVYEDGAIEVDKDVLVNGDFSTDELEGWVEDAGDLQASGVMAADSRYHQDVPAVPGELWAGAWSFQGQPGTSISLEIRNLHTGRWLTPARTWSDDQVAIDEAESSSATLTSPAVFQIEPYSECRTPEVTLRVSLVCNDEGGQWNSVAFWPLTDFAGIFGYNYPGGGIVPSVLSEPAGGFDTLFLRDQGMSVLWAYLNECKRDRRVRFNFSGSPVKPVGFGELVLTQTIKIARPNVPGGVAPKPDLEIEPRFPQERAAAPSGALYVSADGGPQAPRSGKLEFALASPAEFATLRDEIFTMCQGGAHPSILIGPTVLGRELCAFVRFEDRMPLTFPGGHEVGKLICMAEIGWQEDVFPVFIQPEFVETPVPEE